MSLPFSDIIYPRVSHDQYPVLVLGYWDDLPFSKDELVAKLNNRLSRSVGVLVRVLVLQ